MSNWTRYSDGVVMIGRIWHGVCLLLQHERDEQRNTDHGGRDDDSSIRDDWR
jgi:hypothetical protein